MHSACRYWPLISDAAFDEIVSRLDAQWDSVEHRHKALIDRTMLKTGFYLEYPSIVPHAASALVRRFRP